MRFHATILLGVILFAGVGILHAAPATYDGKTVSEWSALLAAKDHRVRRQAAYALGKIGPSAAKGVDALIAKGRGVHDPRLEVRWYAMEALGRIGPAAKASVPLMVEAIEHPPKDQNGREDRRIRIVAAKALGRIGSNASAAVPTLLKTKKAPNDQEFRIEATLALWRIAANPSEKEQRLADVMKTVRAMLVSQNASESYLGAMTIAHLGPVAKQAPSSLVAALIGVLSRDNSDVRRGAVAALATIGPPVMEPLTQALSHAKKGTARRSAADALAMIVTQTREQVFYRHDANATDCALAAKQWREKVIPALLQRLDDPDKKVRKATIHALAAMGPVAAAPLLLAVRNKDKAVQQGATDALIQMEQHFPKTKPVSSWMEQLKQSTVPILLEGLRHPEPKVRRVTLRTFAALSIRTANQEAKPLLTPFLRSEDVASRRYAMKALQTLDRQK